MARPKKTQPVTQPVLKYTPWIAEDNNNLQTRTALPRPCTNEDRLQISSFPMYSKCGLQLTIRNSFLAGFQIIERHMAPSVADELVNFLADSWKSYMGADFEVPNPVAQRPYDILLGLNDERKLLSYSFWFYLAAWYGPGHPDLQHIRQEMSAFWGAEFPTDAIIYPANFSVCDQKKLFAGIPVDLTLNPRASLPTPSLPTPSLPTASLPIISASSDTEMQVRVQDFKEIFEKTPVKDLAKAISQKMPNIPETDASEIDSLKAQLDATRRELENTQKELSSLEKRSQKSLEVAIDAECQYQQEFTEGHVKGLEGKLAETNQRVDKAMEICALLLGIVSAPGGEKRKRDDQT